MELSTLQIVVSFLTLTWLVSGGIISWLVHSLSRDLEVERTARVKTDEEMWATISAARDREQLHIQSSVTKEDLLEVKRDIRLGMTEMEGRLTRQATFIAHPGPGGGD
jgi:hypothetical protein